MTKAQKAQDILRNIPWREISRLVLPQLLLMLTTLLIGLTDTWVAGRISSDVQASVGVIGQIQALMMVLAMSLGAGAMAVISQSLGAKKIERAKRYILFVLIVATGLAICFALIGLMTRSLLIEALGVSPEVRPITLYFWDVLLLALPFHYLYFVSNILFRAAKLVQFPLIIGIIVTTVNVFGDLAFGLGYFGFTAYGVPGIAWATFASVFTGAVVSLGVLAYAKLYPKRKRLPLRWIQCAYPYLFKVALPALCTQALWQTGYLVLFVVTASVPQSTAALAGLAAGMRIESILFMPGAAFNATASILVGHALGAGDVNEAKKLGLILMGIGCALMTTIALCMLPFMHELAALFSLDSTVQGVIVWYLTFNIMSTPFTVMGMVLNGIMTGAGATIYALVINTSSVWLLRLPLAYSLAHFAGMEERGVFLAMLLSMAYQSLAMLYVFIKRPWYTYTMRKISN